MLDSTGSLVFSETGIDDYYIWSCWFN